METHLKPFLLLSLGSLFLLYHLGLKIPSHVSTLKSNHFSFFQEPRLKKIISLGHEGLVEDFVYLDFLNRFHDKKIDHETLRTYFHSVMLTQPKIETIYLLMCYKMSFEWQHPEGCRDPLSKGMVVLPESWKLPFTMGYILAFFLHNFSEAALFYEKASRLKGAPEFLGSFAKKLRTQTIEVEEKIRNLKTLNEMFPFLKP